MAAEAARRLQFFEEAKQRLKKRTRALMATLGGQAAHDTVGASGDDTGMAMGGTNSNQSELEYLDNRLTEQSVRAGEAQKQLVARLAETATRQREFRGQLRAQAAKLERQDESMQYMTDALGPRRRNRASPSPSPVFLVAVFGFGFGFRCATRFSVAGMPPFHAASFRPCRVCRPFAGRIAAALNVSLPPPVPPSSSSGSPRGAANRGGRRASTSTSPLGRPQTPQTPTVTLNTPGW